MHCNRSHNLDWGCSWSTLPKWEWGPRAWRTLHLTAIHYSSAKNPVHAHMTEKRIWDIVNALPCPECKNHAREYILTNPPNMRTSETLQRWVWEFHNFVNVRLKKYVLSMDDYLHIYADEIRASARILYY